jgi:DNA polymerase-4
MLTTQPQAINTALPYTVHIDLNSCFAIIEQQANRLLRGRPVGISAYDTPRGFVLAASYQAKAKGVKLGVNVEQARAMCPGIVIMTPDPAKYREAHKLFKAVLLEYSPDVIPKSIDEFILNLEHSPALKSTKLEILNSRQIPNPKIQISNISYQISETERLIHNQAMLKIGQEIKEKIRERLGEYVTVNIGIATNKFLAKYGAGFGKPDGMTLIDHTNLRDMYKDMKLVDLPGINTRFRARLRINGIYSPLDFLEADLNTLKKQVFKSINGYHWYMRLRGHETDTVEFSRKSIGHQHALSHKTTDLNELERILIKLCEKAGRRLRKNNLCAQGIHLYLGFQSDYPAFDGPASFENMHNIRSWHHGEKTIHRLYSTPDIYEAGKRLLHKAEIPNNVKLMSVTVFNLCDWDPVQLSIFDVQEAEVQGKKSRVGLVDSDIRSMDVRKRTSDAVDAINNRYGEFVVTPAMMMDMGGTILDRIAFGQVRDM